MMQTIKIALTDEQFAELKPLGDALEAANNGEQYGSIVGQCFVDGLSPYELVFWFVEWPFSRRIVDVCRECYKEMQANDTSNP